MPQTTKMIFTIGHSTREFAEFAALLQAHTIETVVDVRRFPGSRRFPQFGQDVLRASLNEIGIQYQWFEKLGGRRSTKNLSLVNGGWQVKAFHAYADYIQTEEFQQALSELETLAQGSRTAYMCAEALWVRCHRRLISDVLVTRGWQVFHIMTKTDARPHELTSFARMQDGTLTYPAVEATQPLLFE
jgi:uncharacterized protein (DUF488 family)